MQLIRPPGILLLASGYGAGLATGLSRLADPVLVVLLLVLLTVVVWREWWFPLVPALLAGIVVGGQARSAAGHWCAATLPLGEQRYRVLAIDPGQGTGRVVFPDRRCEGVVLARWPSATVAAAGSSVAVTARWRPGERMLHRPDGMLLIGAADSAHGAPDAIARVRNEIVRATRLLYGPRAPLANALLAGWRGELDPELRAAFASAGLMHLLAISGLHVGLFAGWVFLLLRLARCSRHRAAVVAALAALAYTACLGWPSAAFRASVLLLLVAYCRWRQRQVRVAALLGASVLTVLIFDPWAIAEPGLWLSIAGLTGLTGALRWSDRAIGTSWWVQGVSGSSGAVLATAPIAAAVFGQVAPIGILLNIAGMPLLVLALPSIAASVLLQGAVPSVAAAFAASANGLLVLLEQLVRAGATAPGSAAPGPVGEFAALPWCAALGAAVWATWRGTTLAEAARRVTWCGVVLLIVTLPFGRPQRIPIDDHQLTMLFVDVGQGDAALIRTPAGHWLEVDAGPIGEGRDAGRRVIAPLLARQGVRRLDLFILSHAHRDHVGGGIGVLERFPVDIALEPGELFADSAYEGWLAALPLHHTRWRVAKAGSEWTVDGVTIRVLHPPRRWLHEGEDLNEDSIVLELSYGGFRALLMGDAGFVAEAAMAGELHAVSLLKVGHHGSRTASGAEFLSTIRPQVAIVSVGRNNYGHPSPDALARLGAVGARSWRTDVEGTVTVSTDGRTFSVKGAGSAATFEVSH